MLRLAESKMWKSNSGLPVQFWAPALVLDGTKMLHFHWPSPSRTGAIKDDLVKMVKKARKVLRVTCMGSWGRARPS